MKKQIIEKEEHNEKIKCEIVSLRKKLEKEKSLNIRFAKGYETLDEIIKFQLSPLINIGLGYNEEMPNTVKSSTEIGSYLNVVNKISTYNKRIKDQILHM